MVKSNSSAPRQSRKPAAIPRSVLDQARKAAFELFHAGRTEQAETMIAGVLAVDAQDPWSQALLGSIRRQQRRFREALALYDAALALDPDNPDLRTRRDEVAVCLTPAAPETPGPAAL